MKRAVLAAAAILSGLATVMLAASTVASWHGYSAHGIQFLSQKPGAGVTTLDQTAAFGLFALIMGIACLGSLIALVSPDKDAAATDSWDSDDDADTRYESSLVLPPLWREESRQLREVLEMPAEPAG